MVDNSDPLLQALKDVFAKDADPAARIFGTAKTYNLGMLPPWSDLSNEEDARSIAKSMLSILNTPNDEGNKMLNPNAKSDSVTIITTCERSLNGKTDDNGVVISRSHADPVDEKYFDIIYRAIHDEVRRDDLQDQMIVISLSACIFPSNDSGEKIQGLNNIALARDEQRIFSNKSDNVHLVQHFDLTPDTIQSMGGFSYAETGVKLPAKPQPLVDSKPQEITVDVRSILPPGTATAAGVSVQRGRGAAFSGGTDTHLVITNTRPQAYEETSAQLLMVHNDTNPLAATVQHVRGEVKPSDAGTTLLEAFGRARPQLFMVVDGAGTDLAPAPAQNTYLDTDPDFIQMLNELKIHGQDMRRESLIELAKLVTVSHKDAAEAHAARRIAQNTTLSLSGAEDLQLCTKFERGITHSGLKQEVWIGTNGTRGDAVAETAAYKDKAEMDDVMQYMREAQGRHGEILPGRISETFAFLQELHAADVAQGLDGATGGAGQFRQRVELTMKAVINSPKDFPKIPIDTARAALLTQGVIPTGDQAGGQVERFNASGASAPERARWEGRSREEQRERERGQERRFEGRIGNRGNEI